MQNHPCGTIRSHNISTLVNNSNYYLNTTLSIITVNKNKQGHSYGHTVLKIVKLMGILLLNRRAKYLNEIEN